jgi:hypothetical protein
MRWKPSYALNTAPVNSAANNGAAKLIAGSENLPDSLFSLTIRLRKADAVEDNNVVHLASMLSRPDLELRLAQIEPVFVILAREHFLEIAIENDKEIA